MERLRARLSKPVSRFASAESDALWLVLDSLLQEIRRRVISAEARDFNFHLWREPGDPAVVGRLRKNLEACGLVPEHLQECQVGELACLVKTLVAPLPAVRGWAEFLLELGGLTPLQTRPALLGLRAKQVLSATPPAWISFLLGVVDLCHLWSWRRQSAPGEHAACVLCLFPVRDASMANQKTIVAGIRVLIEHPLILDPRLAPMAPMAPMAPPPPPQGTSAFAAPGARPPSTGARGAPEAKPPASKASVSEASDASGERPPQGRTQLGLISSEFPSWPGPPSPRMPLPSPQALACPSPRWATADLETSAEESPRSRTLAIAPDGEARARPLVAESQLLVARRSPVPTLALQDAPRVIAAQLETIAAVVAPLVALVADAAATISPLEVAVAGATAAAGAGAAAIAAQLGADVADAAAVVAPLAAAASTATEADAAAIITQLGAWQSLAATDAAAPLEDIITNVQAAASAAIAPLEAAAEAAVAPLEAAVAPLEAAVAPLEAVVAPLEAAASAVVGSLEAAATAVVAPLEAAASAAVAPLAAAAELPRVCGAEAAKSQGKDSEEATSGESPASSDESESEDLPKVSQGLEISEPAATRPLPLAAAGAPRPSAPPAAEPVALAPEQLSLGRPDNVAFAAAPLDWAAPPAPTTDADEKAARPAEESKAPAPTFGIPQRSSPPPVQPAEAAANTTPARMHGLAAIFGPGSPWARRAKAAASASPKGAKTPPPAKPKKQASAPEGLQRSSPLVQRFRAIVGSAIGPPRPPVVRRAGGSAITPMRRHAEGSVDSSPLPGIAVLRDAQAVATHERKEVRRLRRWFAELVAAPRDETLPAEAPQAAPTPEPAGAPPLAEAAGTPAGQPLGLPDAQALAPEAILGPRGSPEAQKEP